MPIYCLEIYKTVPDVCGNTCLHSKSLGVSLGIRSKFRTGFNLESKTLPDWTLIWPPLTIPGCPLILPEVPLGCPKAIPISLETGPHVRAPQPLLSFGQEALGYTSANIDWEFNLEHVKVTAVFVAAWCSHPPCAVLGATTCMWMSTSFTGRVPEALRGQARARTSPTAQLAELVFLTLPGSAC